MFRNEWKVFVILEALFIDFHLNLPSKNGFHVRFIHLPSPSNIKLGQLSWIWCFFWVLRVKTLFLILANTARYNDILKTHCQHWPHWCHSSDERIFHTGIWKFTVVRSPITDKASMKVSYRFKKYLETFKPFLSLRLGTLLPISTYTY